MGMVVAVAAVSRLVGMVVGKEEKAVGRVVVEGGVEIVLLVGLVGEMA